MQRWNTVVFEGSERLEQARSERGPGRGLLTYSNHVSLFDDPLLIACLAEPRWEDMRWIAADALNFFGSPLRGWIFNGGKAVPIVRGVGLDQPGMAFLAERLALGDWVHVFPEGGRSRDAGARLRLPFKAGVAHLVRASRPVLLGFHHRGMDAVLPIGARFPRRGQTVHVRFGEIRDSAVDFDGWDLDAITRAVERDLQALETANAG